MEDTTQEYMNKMFSHLPVELQVTLWKPRVTLELALSEL